MVKRGPNTERGKAASSINAVKHGLRSNAPVIPEVESSEDWDRHRAAIVASWEPEGGFETFLAERVASLSWRLNRVPRYETETTAHHIDTIPDDLGHAAAYGEKLGIPREETASMDRIGELISQRLLPSRDPMERIIRYEGHLHRQLIQTIRELEATQARRKGDRPSPLTRLDVSGSASS